MAAQTEVGPVVFDRGVPDCIAYASLMGIDPSRSIRAAERYRYHEEVLILEPWEEIYTVDDERTMSFADTSTKPGAVPKNSRPRSLGRLPHRR